MMLIFRLDLDVVTWYCHPKYLGQQSCSWNCYCLDTKTHTTNRLLYLGH